MEKIPVRVLILPKFELGETGGVFPGEAQYYFDRYLKDAEVYEVPGGDGIRLYRKDGVALCLLGMGKVNAALGTMAVLSDSRFDFSGAYIISTGCAGSAAEYSVMGDVFIITAAVDYDLGHHTDSREMTNPAAATWFHDASFDDMAVVLLDPDLTEKVYALVKDLPMETTERTRRVMKTAFGGADWALRGPRVLRGTTVTGDNYWKGTYGHANAVLMVKTYGCPDPYAVTEMEDIAVARAVQRAGLLNRLIIVRSSVNMDVFMPGVTPENLWVPGYRATSIAAGENVETADIFDTAMKNGFTVSSTIIRAALNGGFGI